MPLQCYCSSGDRVAKRGAQLRTSATNGQLNVSSIHEEPQLLAVQTYAQTHANPVTLLRAIDKLVEAKAET